MITQSQHGLRSTVGQMNHLRLVRLRWRASASAILVLLLVQAVVATGPDPSRPIRQMRHSSWNEASGLSGVVFSLAQTADGFLWIGTSAGLYRFDGLKFQPFQFEANDPPILEVRALLGTSDGGLWVGYRNGVAFLKKGTSSFYSEQQGLPYGRVSSLAQTRDGAIWASLTLSGGGKAGGGHKLLTGLARFSNGHWERIGSDWNYPATSSERVLVDGAGTLWVTGGGTVHFLLNGKKEFQRTSVTISTWNQACLDSDGSIWIADPATHHLLKFGKDSEKALVVSGRTLQGIYGIHFDRSHSLWFATDRGLYRTAPGLFNARRTVTTDELEKDQFRLKDGLSSDETNVIFEDREGNIWVGTSNGLDRFSDRSVTLTDLGHTPSDLIVGPHTEVWASQFSGSPFLIPLHDSKPYRLSTWFTRTFYMDRHGTLWASMQSNSSWQSRALWKDENGQLTKVPLPPDIKGPLIDGIVADASGRLWMNITGYGEYTLKENKWEKVPVFTGSDENIAPDYEFLDARGRAWLLYFARNMVVAIDGPTRTFFTPGQGLDLGSPIAGAASGTTVWVSGTRGLGVFDGSTFHRIQAADGQQFENASAVIRTAHEGLWLKGPKGIIQIPEDELTAFSHDDSYVVSYRLFDAATDFVTPLAPARSSASDTTAVLSGDGKLWFGVFGGVAMIDPTHLAWNGLPPPVAITSLFANGRTYPTYQDLTLPKSTREVSLDYTALSLTLAERNRFRYQLIGLDNGWRDVGTRRQAFYTNLEPGTYTFKVIAANNDDVWNRTGASLTFTIPPTFLQTIWFRILSALLFALLVWALFLIRLHHMNKETEARLHERLIERERIARDLHDTLLQGFQMLVLRFQVIADTLSPSDPARGMLEESLIRSENALREGRDRVSALREEAGPGDDLANELRRFGEELNAGSTAAFNLSVDGTPLPLRGNVNEEVRMIAREAIANAFCHARAKEITCRLTFGARYFVFICIDDGCGIPEAVFGKKKMLNHWGIVGMQERAREIAAELRFEPCNPTGTKVELKLRATVAYATHPDSTLARLLKRIDR